MSANTDALEPDSTIKDTWRREAGGFLVAMYGVGFGFYHFGDWTLDAVLMAPLVGLAGYLVVELYQSAPGGDDA